MSYATVDNVKSLFRDQFSSSTPAVTDAEIQEFLDDATRVIDAKMSSLYSLPILVGPSPKAFALLGTINKFMAGDMVDDVLNSYSEADKKPEWGEKGKALLNELIPQIDKKTCRQCEPTMKLIDAVYLGTVSGRSKIKLSATSGTTTKKGTNNW